jgi:prepilin-type N-terminal cleavage/methylation domain-containing protein
MWNKARRLVNINTNAFTIIEVLMAMVIVGVVIGAIYAVFVSSNRSYHTQDSVVEAQQRVRVGIDFMVRDIRMAGFAPLGSATDAHPLDSDGAGIKEATSSKIRFTSDIDVNGVIDNPKNQERVTYEYDSDNERLRRCIYEGFYEEGKLKESWQTLIEKVSALQFTYLRAGGDPLGDPVAADDLADISTVVISMTVEGEGATGQTITRSLNTRVSCRNLNL